MKEVQWGKLARLQDDLIKNEQLKKKQRQNHHKQLYKRQLESMIDEKKKYSRTIQQIQRNQYREMTNNSSNIQESTPQQQKFDLLLKESSKYNYNRGRERKMRMKSELDDEKETIKGKYKKIETEISEEQHKILESRELRKKQLANYYQNQIHQGESKKYMERLQNQKFQQVAEELGQKKDRDRINHLNKIKFGYNQNPETLDTIRQIYSHQQKQKLSFLIKLEHSKNEDNSQELDRQKKHSQTIEASKFNKNFFMQKKFNKKLVYQQELEEEHNKLLTIQKELFEQEERKKRRKNSQRKLLQTELDHQISQGGQSRMKSKRMSQNQSRINKQLFSHELKAMIPGLITDHKDIKREQILNSFLKQPTQHPTAIGYHALPHYK